MRGLLLTNYYLVYRSIFAYTGLAISVSGIILYFGGASMRGIAALLIILLMAVPSLEVIKSESKSGYDKYVLTLPVRRSNIVQSHYFFYFSVAFIGALLSYVILYVSNLMSDTPSAGIFNTVSIGTFIVLFVGAIVYPFLYIFGPEKSDGIIIGSGFVAVFATFGLRNLVDQIPNINPSLYVPVIYIIFGVIIYVLSYFISVFIYHKKEF
ncbi:ABC-2 transporter permease [Paenibacillus thiaminolyticus]|uniref:ABC-2 transporter permease n=1 Tax=Paenibacillus TaxID=44249 RepID=UPI00105A9383|nr:ABC-2 transporter permease [Paenibacillus dendritiformis]TDL47410.1 ABC-2 transporter permease [Paenibacillus dendritiformis]